MAHAVYVYKIWKFNWLKGNLLYIHTSCVRAIKVRDPRWRHDDIVSVLAHKSRILWFNGLCDRSGSFIESTAKKGNLITVRHEQQMFVNVYLRFPKLCFLCQSLCNHSLNRLLVLQILQCPSSFDSVLCWPRTNAGSLAVLPCIEEFKGIHYDTTGG